MNETWTPSPAEGHASVPAQHSFQPFGNLTPWLLALAGVYLAFSVIAQLAELGGNPVLVGSVGFFSGVVTIGLVVVGAMWFYRAGQNADQMGAQNRTWSPVWGVFIWLIPVANIILPYLYTREVWKASDPEAGPTDWPKSEVPDWFHLWWILWGGAHLLSLITAGLVFFLTVGSVFEAIASGAEPQETIPVWMQAARWVHIAMIAAAYPLFMRVVKGLAERQRERGLRLQAQDLQPQASVTPDTRPYP